MAHLNPGVIQPTLHERVGDKQLRLIWITRVLPVCYLSGPRGVFLLMVANWNSFVSFNHVARGILPLTRPRVQVFKVDS